MITEIFLSLFLVWLSRYVITAYTKRRNMPGGPFPYPFVGNIPQIIRAGSVSPFTKLAEKYGDIFTVTLPQGNAVILNTTSLAREARLAGKQEDIAGRLPNFIYPLADMTGKNLFTSDYSPEHCFRKKVFVTAMHVFGAGREQASARAGHAVKIAIKNIEDEPGRSFCPKNLFESSIRVQLWEWLTSKKIGLDDPIIKQTSELSALLTKQAMLSTLYQLFPFLCYLPTRFRRDIQRAIEIKNTIFPAEYREHEESYIPGVIRDLTDSFICAYDKEIQRKTSKEIGSKDDIPGLMFNVALAGSETTSTCLSWLFLYLVLYPDVQKKIHEELDAIVGRERLPRWKDAGDMPYIQATLCEVLRASGMFSLSGTNAIRDTTIAGYHIPKGTFVGINFRKLHHNGREWPEPNKFKPERFLDRESKFVGWNKLHGFLPFGIGRRECPGHSLAKVMLFSFTSMILQRYKIDLPEGAMMPSTTVSTPQMIIRPNDFLVVAKPRNQLGFEEI